jgi:hypothetical protein
MAHYAIMRGEKRKTGDVRGVTAHIARSQPTPNADSSKAHLNYAVVGPAWDDQEGINDAIEARTPKKYRKDAIRAIEYVVSASPEWFEANTEQQAALYFEAATDWFQDQFGTANVVSAVVHNDESSPHMHVLVVPLDAETGRLNGKWFFGNKGVLQKRQSRFADHMAPFGVERGKADPQRTHTKISEWRAGHAQLDDREASLKAREASAAAQMQKAANESGSAVTAYSLARKERSAVEFEKNQLADREAVLDQRERELNEKTAALAAAAERFEQQKAAWIVANKPSTPPEVRHLQHMETLQGPISISEYMCAQSAEMAERLEDLYDVHDGPTERGKALLEQYSDVEKRAEQFDQAFTPSDTPGL